MASARGTETIDVASGILDKLTADKVAVEK
jgi:hypothetical protein